MKTLEDQVVAAGQVVSTQDAINLAVASIQYKQASASFSSVSFSGANDGWSYDSSCKVTWTGIAVNFLMLSANGSKYTLVVSENPLLGVIYWVETVPTMSAAISPQCNSPPYYPPCNWSGYAIAADSPQTGQVFESDARWFVPPISEPSGPFQPSCTTTNPCVLLEWVGVTDEKPSMAPGSGTIVQAGIESQVYDNPFPPPTTITTYKAWTEVYCTNGSSWCQLGVQYCMNPHPNSGDQMQSSEENQLAYNGTPGTNYYIFLNDWTQSWLCTAQPNGNPVNVNFTPHYAAFIAERNNPSAYHLAQFQDWYFTLCAFYVGSYQGVYSNYNSGYGYGVYMENSASIDTNTATMSQVGNGYGQFTIHWQTSQGT
jgi:hypothetical protein